MNSSTMLTAKDILLSYVPGASPHGTKAKKRGTAHEFQDYAYRLAADLGDLDNLAIYMRLAKKHPHWLLERVYEFVADINEEQKGALFMWKFKQLRQELYEARNKKNFDTEFLETQVKLYRNRFALKIMQQADVYAKNALAQYLVQQQLLNSFAGKILFVGYSSSLLLSGFIAQQLPTYGIDISYKMRALVYEKFSSLRKGRFIAKSFWDHSYKPAQFSTIIAESSWSFLAEQDEQRWLDEIAALLEVSGECLIQVSRGSESAQLWQISSIDDTRVWELVKRTPEDLFIEKARKSGFTVVHNMKLHEATVFRLRKNAM